MPTPCRAMLNLAGQNRDAQLRVRRRIGYPVPQACSAAGRLARPMPLAGDCREGNVSNQRLQSPSVEVQ